jgi:hypothetical protein
MADSSDNSVDLASIDDAILRSTDAPNYGVTTSGFVPKPFSRLLAEKLALARTLFGSDLDLGAGSALRKILELSSLEDARTWAALASIYDNQYVASAQADGLSRLGEELGLPRPSLEAQGTITLTAHLPAGVAGVTLPYGARLLTPGQHDVALDETVVLSVASPVAVANVVAFYPGPDSNLDPSDPNQKITWWNQDDPKLAWDSNSLLSVAHSQNPNVPPEQIVSIQHTLPLTGGELFWPDDRYRALLLSAPRSLWTVDSIRVALSLVPGVRQVQVRDLAGGLDADLPIFGQFDFLERLFGAERDIASPYYFDVVVASTDSAIWDGPNGLAVALDAAVEDLRPMGIRPRIQPADPVYVGIQANLVVSGLALPRGSSAAAINVSPPAVALKQRLLARVGAYIEGLGFGEPVRFAEVMATMMSEPGVVDVQDLLLLVPTPPPGSPTITPGVGDNVPIKPTQIATFVDTDTGLTII